ncbi:hypothetical protein GE061_000990 [Apolygus lucorum]|uniref:DUF4780 domain-containing protein n=1 Tax=Apolygus lucorum TaxID=248454 RepID=A0A6A4K8B8_APOLU|nr:hypothetical protein GE061_000990 [Apolygus lucorum]
MVVAGGAHVDPPTTDQEDDPGGNNGASNRPAKKLSGAQKRKLARLRAQEQGLPPRPRKKSKKRGEAGGGVGAVPLRAAVPGGSGMLAMPGSSGTSGIGGLRGSAPPPSTGSKSAMEGTPRKRNRDSHGTPPSDAKKPPAKKPRETGSGQPRDPPGAYSDALSSTKMAVTHGNHPAEQLSDVEANLVYGSIVRAAMDSPAGQGPQFCSGHTSNGVVYITCSNGRSKGWLEEQVAELKPWDGASLRTGPAKDLADLVRVKVGVWIPTEFLDRSDARKLIPLFEAQNPGLSTREWKLLSTKADPKGLSLVLNIDTDSLGWLRGQQFRAFFHVQRVTFKVMGAPTDAAGGSDQPAAQ